MNTPSALARFTIELSEPSNETVIVHWETYDGTAVAGIDYQFARGFCEFLPGVTARHVEVLVFERAVTTPNRWFELALTPPANAALANASALCNIVAGDTPEVSIVVATGPTGASAFEDAQRQGYQGTLEEWLQGLIGEPGKNVELQSTATHLQWRVEGGEQWHNLLAWSDIRPADATVDMQVADGFVQWRPNDEPWRQLIAIADLKGEPGDPGEGPDNPEDIGAQPADDTLTAIADAGLSPGTLFYVNSQGELAPLSVQALGLQLLQAAGAEASDFGLQLLRAADKGAVRDLLGLGEDDSVVFRELFAKEDSGAFQG